MSNTTQRAARVRIRRPDEAPAAEARPEQPAPAFGVAPKVFEVVDGRGRRLGLKKLTALDRMQLSLIVGAAASENRAFMVYANLAASVFKIDDDIASIDNMRTLNALVAQLDEDGLEAVMRGWTLAGWNNSPVAEDAPERGHEADVKN